MVHFKWLNYMVCALLYLNKVVFKNCQGLWGAGEGSAHAVAV